MDKKILVAYFSCSGVTAGAAKALAEAAGADLYEIKPEIPYTQADLNSADEMSRSSIEMKDSACRPAIAGKVSDIHLYETIFIGFPIWWYIAPKIINTFLESYDFTGKTLVVFCTSGGSGLGDIERTMTEKRLKKDYPSINWVPGKLLNKMPSKEELAAWVKSIE